MNHFHEQRYARMAREAFAERGRGVLIVHIDRAQQTLRAEYNTIATDNGSDAAAQVRALVDAYEPSRQIVMVYRDPACGRETIGIVDIEAHH